MYVYIYISENPPGGILLAEVIWRKIKKGVSTGKLKLIVKINAKGSKLKAK